MSDELVTVCTCSDMVQAQAIRGSLEARGVPVLVDGEHQRNVLGMLGTVVDLRIMVPRSQLRLAHTLALEIIEDLPPLELDDDEGGQLGREDSPLRRALPGELDPPDDEYEYDDEYEDDEDEEDDEDALDEVEDQAQLAEMRAGYTLMWRRLIVAGWTAMALMAFVFTGSIRALLSLGILAALVVLGVLPLRAARARSTGS